MANLPNWERQFKSLIFQIAGEIHEETENSFGQHETRNWHIYHDKLYSFTDFVGKLIGSFVHCMRFFDFYSWNTLENILKFFDIYKKNPSRKDICELDCYEPNSH